MKQTILKLLVLLFFAGLCSKASAFSSPFEVLWDDEPLKLSKGNDLSTDIIIRIPENHYIYKDRTDLSFTVLDGIQVKNVIYPETIKMSLDGKETDVYPPGDMRISVIFHLSKGAEERERNPEALLEFEGCEKEFCLRPEKHNISWKLVILPPNGGVSQPQTESISSGNFSISDLLNSKKFDRIVSKGWYIAFLVAFLAGLLSSFTPCVWPLIPVTLLIVGVHKKGRIFENFLLSVSIVVGIAVTYSLIGVIATAIGSTIGFLFQSRWFIALVILFFLLMSLAVLGFLPFNIPHRMQGFFAKLGGRGYKGAFLTGVSLGFLATPCTGPILAPMALWVAAKKEYLFGGILLAVYSVGLGTFYIIAGTFYGSVAGRLKNIRIGNFVKKVLAVALLVPAFYYAGSLFNNSGPAANIDWKLQEEEALIESAASAKPVMIVVGAKWCPPCNRLENDVLTDEKISKLAKSFVMFHIDATRSSGETDRLINKYEIAGWPTIIFIDSKGNVLKDLTIAGNAPSVENLSKVMEEVIGRGK